MMLKRILPFFIAGGMFGCTSAPTQEQSDALFAQIHKTIMDRSSSYDDKVKTVEDMLSSDTLSVDVDEMEAGHFRSLLYLNTLRRCEPVKEWATPRLQELTNGENSSEAYLYLAQFNSKEGGANIDPAQIANAKGFDILVADEIKARGYYNLLRGTALSEKELEELYQPITAALSSKPTMSLLDIGMFVQKQLLKNGDATKQLALDLRNTLISASKVLVANGEKSSQLKNINTYLESNLSQGKFIGYDAPALDFIWTSTSTVGKSLEDLKGKVVVLDFWTTWCGPCVASFPNVRKLASYYKGYDVVILGVTSLQGRHIEFIDGKRKTILTNDDPAAEYKLMEKFMEQMEMNWPVVFTKEGVFNPTYGVEGIPAVFIVNAEGKLAYSGLNPLEDLQGKVDKINKLLKEAGKKVPTKKFK